jgi:hypothetical protein
MAMTCLVRVASASAIEAFEYFLDAIYIVESSISIAINTSN